MVTYCTICKNNTRKQKELSYFCYPRDVMIRELWLKAVGREDLIPKITDYNTRQRYRICAEHFEGTEICYSKNKTKKYLSDTAFPTLNLPSIETDFSVAKIKWKNLRDTYRDLKKKMISISNTTSRKSPKRWQYLGQMEFLAPHMHLGDQEQCNNTSTTAAGSPGFSETDQSDVLETEQTKAVKEEQEDIVIEEGPENMQQVDRQVEEAKEKMEKETETAQEKNTQNESLKAFFESMLLSTSRMPEVYQITIKKELFKVVMDAEESIANGW